MKRHVELTRYAHRLFDLSALTNDLYRTLEEVEKRSRQLREEGKAGDSGEVVKLVEQLQEAITHYQVSRDFLIAPGTTHTEGQTSQLRAIYHRIVDLTVRAFRFISTLYTDDRSFRQVFFRYPLKASRGDVVHRAVTMFINTRTEIPRGEEQAEFRHGTAG